MIRSMMAALAAALSLVALAPAEASVITMHTRHSGAAAPNLGSDAANAEYYRALLESAIAVAPTAGYCDASPLAYAGLANHVQCGGGVQELAFAFVVDFHTSGGQGDDFGLRIGPDFGRGGALFLDGQLLAVRTSDMWWAGSFGQPAQIFQALGLDLDDGAHRLVAYGLEGCCDGAQQGEFRLGASGAWTVFSTTDALQPPAAAPEPGSLALLAAALAALAWRSLRRPFGRPLARTLHARQR